jgi:hypothetical protein
VSAHGCRDFADGIEDVVLVGGLGVFAGDGVAVVGDLGSEGDEVAGAELDDAAGEVGLDAFALGDFASEGGGENAVKRTKVA